jgi:hypothetical protein
MQTMQLATIIGNSGGIVNNTLSGGEFFFPPFLWSIECCTPRMIKATKKLEIAVDGAMSRWEGRQLTIYI